MPSTVSDGGTSTLTIALADNETFGIQALGSTYQFTLSGGAFTFVDGGVASTGDFSAFGGGSLTLQASGIARYDTIRIVDVGTNTDVDLIDSGGNGYSETVTIALDNNPKDEAIQIRESSFSGSAGLIASATANIRLISGESITTGDGPVSLTGDNSGRAADSLIGVEIQGPITTTGGDVTLTGTGGPNGGTNSGVRLVNGGMVTTTSGDVVVTGTAGGGESDGVDVFNTVSGPVTGITSVSGDISISGTSPNGSGVSIASGATVRSTGTGPGAGTITVEGTSAGHDGVRVAGAEVASVAGAIFIAGDTDAGGPANAGVLLLNEGLVTSTGTGPGAATITIEGGNVDNAANVLGLRVGTNNGLSSRVTSVDGAISLMGRGTGGGGVAIDSSAVQAAGGADITITGTDAGASGNGNSDGVRFGGDEVQVMSAGGDIAIAGTVSGDDGLQFATNTPSTVATTGAGSILLQGTSTAGGSFGEGVLIGATQVSTAGGSIQVIGTTSSNRGIWINTSSTFLATGAGAITFDGKSTGVDNGVLIENSQVSAGAGDIAFTGTGVASSSGVQLSNTPVSTVDGDIQAHGTTNGGNAFATGGTSALQATGNGQVLVYATGGNLTVAGTISTAAGAIVLSSFDSAAAGNNVTVNGTVGSAANSLTIRAGDNAIINSSATINVPTGVFEVVADFGDADPGTGSTVTITGVLQTGSPGQILGGPGNDTFNLFPSLTAGTPNSTNVSVTGGDGDDAYTVFPAKVIGPIDLIETPGGGDDRLTVNGSVDADTMLVSGSRMTFGAAEVNYANIETLTANSGNGADTINVTPSMAVAMTINAGTPGAPPPGDTLNFQVPAGQTASVTNNGNGSGVIETTGGYLDVTFSGIETLVVPPPRVVSFFALYGNGRSYDLLANPERDLPWQVTGIRAFFSEPVNAAAGSLSFTGTGAPTVSDVSGSGTNTVTWTFTTPVSDGDLNAILASGGASGPNGITAVAGGAPLDGDPNGAGPDPFSQALDVLYGDVDGDRFVNSRDASLVLARTRGQAVAVPDRFLDVNGDGVVDSADLAIVRGRSGRRL